MYGEEAEHTVTSTILPPVVAVDMAGSETRSAIEALEDRPDIYAVTVRDELGRDLLPSVRLVQEQFKDQLAQLSVAEHPDVSTYASVLAEPGAFEASPHRVGVDLIGATEPLMEFVDESCQGLFNAGA